MLNQTFIRMAQAGIVAALVAATPSEAALTSNPLQDAKGLGQALPKRDLYTCMKTAARETAQPSGRHLEEDRFIDQEDGSDIQLVMAVGMVSSTYQAGSHISVKVNREGPETLSVLYMLSSADKYTMDGPADTYTVVRMDKDTLTINAADTHSGPQAPKEIVETIRANAFRTARVLSGCMQAPTSPAASPN